MSNILQFPKKATPQPFAVGDTILFQDGIRIHVVEERTTASGRQLLLSAHGIRTWMDESRLVRA